MSLRLETLNMGAVENFGFSHGGVHRVLLGELPAMPTPQFCLLATTCLLEVSDKLGEQDWERIGQRLQLAFERDSQTQVDKESILDLPKLLLVDKESEQSLSEGDLNMMIQTVSLSPDLAERLKNANAKEQKRLYDRIIANLIIKNGWTATDYLDDPFVVGENSILIGDMYELSFLEFGLFVSQVLAGGWFGWEKDQGMPKAAKNAIANLKQIW